MDNLKPTSTSEYQFDKARWDDIKSEYNKHEWDVVIGDLDTRQVAIIKESILSMQVSYSMSEVTQLSISLIDPGFEMLKANYFTIGRDIIYRTKSIATTNRINNKNDQPGQQIESKNYYELKLEISSMNIAQGPGMSPAITIMARSKPVQQMQRYKNANELKTAQAKISGKNSAIGFLQYLCFSFGLDLVADPLISKTSSINVSSDATKSSDSAWDVASRIASDNNCAIFEVDGTLYVVKLKTLLGKWGTEIVTANMYNLKTNTISSEVINAIPILYPPPYGKMIALGKPRYEDFILTQIPQISKSDKDPYQCQADIFVDRFAGTSLRPGMTVALWGIPTLSDVFIINSVTYDEMSVNPVSVTLIKPERDDKDKAIQDYLVGGKYFAAEAPTLVL
jgi:hypothetical protein